MTTSPSMTLLGLVPAAPRAGPPDGHHTVGHQRGGYKHRCEQWGSSSPAGWMLTRAEVCKASTLGHMVPCAALQTSSHSAVHPSQRDTASAQHMLSFPQPAFAGAEAWPPWLTSPELQALIRENTQHQLRQLTLSWRVRPSHLLTLSLLWRNSFYTHPTPLWGTRHQ